MKVLCITPNKSFWLFLVLSITIACYGHTSPMNNKNYSPAAEKTHPTNVYFGDTHLHTNLSLDAYMVGNKKLGPEEAYRFAKGEAVVDNNGFKTRLRRPLDFLVIADHATNMGLYTSLSREHHLLGKSDQEKTILQKFRRAESLTDKGQRQEALDELNAELLFGSPPPVLGSEAYRQSIWSDLINLSDSNNDPGVFTALTGFEWTPINGESHRVVIFKDGEEKVSNTMPFSRGDSEDPEDLWRYLNQYQQQTGGKALAILHNSNVSYGKHGAFSIEDSKGKLRSENYMKTRARWEPLVEVTQTKGDSETHPLLSPDDEFADFERWNNWGGSHYLATEAKEAVNKNARWKEILADSIDTKTLQYKYVRSALKLGLTEQARLGVNPFKLGLIGSTDSHAGISAADNDNYREPTATRIYKRYGLRWGWEMAASGYAAVWARENTRESLFAAMKRKEVYATTGPRMTVRFFGGWSYQLNDAYKFDLATVGYAKGVPMGGDLSHGPKGNSPNFLIRAVRDPDGANLDRIQVIKGWRTESGGLQEKIYNVALSDGRKVRRNGKVISVGSTVDIEDASYTNSIGNPELTVVWTDPDFNPVELAFYYVRVLEIPTPRWTAYDAKFFGLTDLPKDITLVTQERAYTSPIWYAPTHTNFKE